MNDGCCSWLSFMLSVINVFLHLVSLWKYVYFTASHCMSFLFLFFTYFVWKRCAAINAVPHGMNWYSHLKYFLIWCFTLNVFLSLLKYTCKNANIFFPQITTRAFAQTHTEREMYTLLHTYTYAPKYSFLPFSVYVFPFIWTHISDCYVFICGSA